MTPEQIRSLYDEGYAARYDAHFLLTPNHGFQQKMRIELFTLQMLTRGVERWLDVACGTGFYLRYGRAGPDLAVTGLDLSPAMLALARSQNPDATLVEGNFLDGHAAFDGAFGLVSSLWGAYGLQQTLGDIEGLIENLARWTRPGGSVFMPVFMPERFVQLLQGDNLMPGVSLDEPDGTAWTYLEPDGKCHTRVLAPPVDWLVERFERHFERVEVQPYPPAPGVPMAGLIARGRSEMMRSSSSHTP